MNLIVHCTVEFFLHVHLEFLRIRGRSTATGFIEAFAKCADLDESLELTQRYLVARKISDY